MVARVRTVRQAAQLYRELNQGADHSECPTVQDLVDAKMLHLFHSEDPWGSRYHVLCDGDEIHGFSPGPDGKPSTPDDVRDDVTPTRH